MAIEFVALGPGDYDRAKRVLNRARHPGFVGRELFFRCATTGAAVIAIDGEQDLGVALIVKGKLQALSVVVAAQGRGVGQALMRHTQPKFVSAIMDKVPWFAKLGYQAVGAARPGRNDKMAVQLMELSGEFAEQTSPRIESVGAPTPTFVEPMLLEPIDLDESLDEALLELFGEGTEPPPRPFSLAAFAGSHAKQLAFVNDRSHRVHVMCARQSGKSQGDDGILMDVGLTRPNSTNLILGLNGPAIRNNNWEPIWKRMFDRFSGLDSKWRNETRMLTTFPNGARVFMGGSDDARHIKNLLGGRIEDGVVIIDECQDQGHVLDELLDSILPPMMGMNARLILSGVFPEIPAGRFWRESGWTERNGVYVQEKRGSWSTHNWGRLDNTHTPDARLVLDRYLADTGLTEDHPQIQRDWFGRPAFDPAATAYHYRAEANAYVPVIPDWMRAVWAEHEREPEDKKTYQFAHPMRLDKHGGRYGMMAAEPLPGVNMFAVALDPGATADRAAIEAWGWGEQSRIVQHLFDWNTPRAANLTTGKMFAVLGLIYRTLARIGGQRGGVVRARYDAGSSQNTIDNLQGDYGIPLVLAAKKTDMKGQVDRNNTLLEESRAKVMVGSALEQDYQRARWDKIAAGKGQWHWAAAWHPNASEAGRYGLQDYFDAYVPPPPEPKDDMERHRAQIRAELAEIARAEAARSSNDSDPNNW